MELRENMENLETRAPVDRAVPQVPLVPWVRLVLEVSEGARDLLVLLV